MFGRGDRENREKANPSREQHAIQTCMIKVYKHTPTHLPILPIYTANPIIPPILPIYTADSYPTEAPHTPSTAGPHLAATFCLAVESCRIVDLEIFFKITLRPNKPLKRALGALRLRAQQLSIPHKRTNPCRHHITLI